MKREENLKYGQSIASYKGLLSNVGQMTLQSSSVKPYSSSRLMQEISDNEQFKPLTNVTTTFIDKQGKTVDLTASKASNHNSNITNDVLISTAANRLMSQQKQSKNEAIRLLKDKINLQADKAQYAKIMHQFSSNSISTNQILTKKSPKNLFGWKDEDEQLIRVQRIIRQMQEVVNQSLKSNDVKLFKNETNKGHHSDKHSWRSKDTEKFNGVEATSRLQELLLNYTMDDRNQILSKQVAKIPEVQGSARKNKNYERKARNKQYHQISKSLNNTFPETKPLNMSEPQLKSISSPKNTEKNISSQRKSQIKMENIELVEIDWMKLPIILNSFTVQNGQLYLQMKDYPEDVSFIEAINDSMISVSKYQTYSIFNSKYKAGIKTDKTLMSEQEFRQTWAQQWQSDIDQEQTKEQLCQLDFQWYRSLVQAVFSFSLQDILVKGISYQIEVYSKQLQRIYCSRTNHKNTVQSPLSLPFQIMQNKLKFVDCLLTKYAREKQNKTHQICLVIAVIPNISNGQTPELFAQLKIDIQTLFKGGLYSQQPQSNCMGVIITQDQSQRAHIQKHPTHNIVSIDGHIQLLINEPASISSKSNMIILKREKSKNSNIRIVVKREGESEMELQVGEQLHLGRRYHIFFD